jgi:uncharacterized membrane protein
MWRVRHRRVPADTLPSGALGGGLAGIVSTRTREGCTPVNRMANAARSEPEPNGDQLTQAVTVGLCLALAAVLLVLALVP